MIPEQVRTILDDTLTGDGLEHWWENRNRYLEWRCPVDVWRHDPDLVIEAAEAYASGDYA